MPHAAPRYPSVPGKGGHHPAVVVGGGLVGLTLALDLAQQGVPVVLLDDDDSVSTGSRAICMAKRSLEIYGRLGLGRRMLEKGVTWNTGRVFFGDRQLFQFDLLPEHGHEYPAFINLQQYYAEEWLVEACAATGLVDLRWKHRVAAVHPRPGGADIEVEAPDGAYSLSADWLLACDGARSQVRRSMDLPFLGRVFRDRFLIADVVMTADFPTERWFWFDPPFHRNQSALLHKQPDGVWRIDLQLGWDADPELETRPERVIPRVQAMLGPDAKFELEWVSIYTFRCRRLERFVHDRVVFVGDSAHQVSPFGARGGNGGVQDADNLAWKLAAVIAGRARPALIRTYDDERIPAADENILHSTRATDFITPKTPAARAYRDAALVLAESHDFARAFINSGRLSRPSAALASPLNAPDTDTWPAALPPGSPAIDAPLVDGWLLHKVRRFTLLHFEEPPPAGGRGQGEGGTTSRKADSVGTSHPHSGPLPEGEGEWRVVSVPATGLAAQRYGAFPGACVLLRPDQHVLANFRRYDEARIRAAIGHALMRAPALERVA
jgi:3-(3-hydroxy-phenyl)propionate hydroxylase